MKNEKCSIEAVLSKKELKRQELTQILQSDCVFLPQTVWMLCVTHNTSYLNRLFPAHRGIFLLPERPKGREAKCWFLQEVIVFVFCQNSTKHHDFPGTGGEGECPALHRSLFLSKHFPISTPLSACVSWICFLWLQKPTEWRSAALNKGRFLSDALWGWFAGSGMFLYWHKAGAEEHFLEVALVVFNLLLFPPSWIFLYGLQAGVIGKSWL